MRRDQLVRCDAKRTAQADEVVIHHVQRDRVSVVVAIGVAFDPALLPADASCGLLWPGARVAVPGSRSIQSR